MFSKIQKQLLIEKPLLWNTKFIPALGLTLLFHIIFFVIGYFSGEINFNYEGYYYGGIGTGITIFFSVLVTILFFVLWCVYYFRNNAFKSFYHLNPFYLYKEFLIVLVICFLNVTYSSTYYAGRTLKQRSYYTQEETRKRSETIVMASIFIQENLNIQSDYNYNNDSIKFDSKEKKYDRNSLMNSSVGYFGKQSFGELEIKVKTWMQEDNQAAIKNLMNDYFKLIKEHKLKTNLTPQKWFEITYNHPEFTQFELINHDIPNKHYDDTNDYSSNNDSVVVAAMPANSNNSYYLPHRNLETAYQIIFDAWYDSIIDTGVLLFLCYLALSLATMIFSFKVSNGRSWLIAFIGIGVLSIIGGIFSAITSSGIAYLVYWLLLILAAFIYFYITVSNNKGKGFSGVALNVSIWSSLGLLPILYALAKEYYDDSKQINLGTKIIYKNTPQYEWLNSHELLFGWLNILIVILFIALFCISIKKWKALAES